jgi:hypothetical protein
MHPLQTKIANDAEELVLKLGGKKKRGAPVLFKYQDPEGNTFWLDKKQMTVKSPFSGKSFSAKPEKDSLGEVGQDLKEKAKSKMKNAGLDELVEQAAKVAAKTATPVLFKYTDPEGNDFWLDQRQTTVKSPYSGKSFTTKPEKDTISEVGKELREEAKAKKASFEVMTADKAKESVVSIDRILQAHKRAFDALQDISIGLGSLSNNVAVSSDAELGPIAKEAEVKFDRVFEVMASAELQRLRALLGKRAAELESSEEQEQAEEE